jgi:glycosyltransferase involved in cell wall biosynthesis
MKVIFFANTDWYLYNFRLAAARELSRLGHEVIMLSPPGDFGHRFADYGIRGLKINLNRSGMNPISESLAIRELTRLIRHEKPHLLHNFTVKASIYGAFAGRLARVPAVINAVAGLGYVFTENSLKARLLRPWVKLMMRLTLNGDNSLLILQNPDDAQAFTASNLVSEKKIRVIRSSGVDTSRFIPRSELLGGKLRVLLVARLLWEKGIGEFIESARILRSEGRDIEFILAGAPDSGNPRSAKREDVEKWVNEGLVVWLGHVEAMPALLQSVHVMALPSYYREGVPRSLIEGASSGLAIITTDRPGCREVVEKDGVDGLRVAPKNSVELAAQIARLDDDRELLQRLGLEARRKALENFDERIVIEKTIDAYCELLGPASVRQQC